MALKIVHSCNSVLYLSQLSGIRNTAPAIPKLCKHTSNQRNLPKLCRHASNQADFPKLCKHDSNQPDLPKRCKHASNQPELPKLKDNIYTIPNALSLSRILLSPVTAYMVISGQHTHALILFGVAGITDFLDGQIARRYPSQRSLLGSIIDPVGDKVLMGLTTLAVWYSALMPGWLACVILGRDVVLLTGGLVAKYKSLEKFSLKNLFNVTDGTMEVKPGWHGKVNMCLQLGAVLGCIAAPVWSFQGHAYFDAYLMLTGLTGIYSLVRYMITYKQVIGRIQSQPHWMKKK